MNDHEVSPLLVGGERGYETLGVLPEDVGSQIAENRLDIEQLEAQELPSIEIIVPEDGHLSLLQASWEILHHSAKLVSCRLVTVAGYMASFSILGRRNADYLAASSFINSVQLTLIYTATGPINIVGIDVKGALAANRFADVGVVYRNGLKMGVILGLPAALAAWGIGPFFSAIGQQASVVRVITDYEQLYSFAIPVYMILLNNLQLIMATKNYRFFAIQSILFAGLISSLSYLFMNGKFGFPMLNAYGVGLATNIAGWSSALLTTIYFALSNRYKPYQLFNTNHVNHNISLWDMFKRGFPISIQIAVETVYTVIITAFMGLISTDAASATAPIWSWAILLTPITMAVAMQAAFSVKTALTQGRFQDARQYGFASLMVGQIIPLINMVLCYTIPRSMLSVFMDVNSPSNANIVTAAETFSQIASFALIGDGIRLPSGGALRSYDDTSFSMAVGIGIVLVSGSFLSLILDLVADMGGNGLLTGRTLSFVTGGFIMLLHWYRKSHAVSDAASYHEERSHGLKTDISLFFTENPLAKFFKNCLSNDMQNTLPRSDHSITELSIQQP